VREVLEQGVVSGNVPRAGFTPGTYFTVPAGTISGPRDPTAT